MSVSQGSSLSNGAEGGTLPSRDWLRKSTCGDEGTENSGAGSLTGLGGFQGRILPHCAL